MALFFEGLFDTAGFPARWYCGRWSPLHGWLHIGADVSVFGAYAAISLALVYFVRSRRDAPFLPVFWLFAAFIAACGIGHLIDASIFFQPRYRLLTAAKLITAVVSWLTAIALVRTLPKALAFQARERHLTLAVRGSNDGVWDHDLVSEESVFSERFSELLEYAPGELEPHMRTWTKLIHPEDRSSVQAALALHLSERVPFDVETRLLTKSGAPRWFRVRGQAVRNADGKATRVAGSLTDISAGKITALAIDSMNAELDQRVQERTAELSAMLREREVLLREVHHRVKNNLQVISSLINLQRQRMDASPGRDGLRECQSRVLTIARVHELLYGAKDAARIPLAEYVQGLVSELDHMGDASRVQIVTDVEDVSVSIDSGVPCGLILNELITNALKHAFTDGRTGERSGTIRVSVHRSRPAELTLQVSDDGVGLPSDFEARKRASLGLTIVEQLASQIKGRLELSRVDGTSFRITFPAPDLVVGGERRDGSLLPLPELNRA